MLVIILHPYFQIKAGSLIFRFFSSYLVVYARCLANNIIITLFFVILLHSNFLRR